MCAPKFPSNRFQHSPRERAFCQMFPKIFSWYLIGANCLSAGSKSAETIAVEHPKTFYFPTPPVFGLAPKADRYAGHAKIQVGQIRQLLAVDVAALDDHSPPAPDLLGGRANL